MAVGKRRTAREMAVQMLYQSDLGGSNLPQIFNTFDLAEYISQEAAAQESPAAAAEIQDRRATIENDREAYAKRRKRVEDAFQYAQALVRGTLDHRQQIDDMIRGQADNWRLERMPPVDRNIL